jgi:outer membrane protein
MRQTLLTALALVAAAPLALAQEAAGGEPRAPRVAVIDMNRISSESALGKGLAAQIEALQTEIQQEGTKKQQELQKLDTEIRVLQEELEKQGAVLSPDAAEKKRQEIVRKSRDRQAFLEDGQAEMQRMRERAQERAQALSSEFQLKIHPHIEAAAKEKGFDIVLYDGAMAINREFDISRDVIAKANEAEKAAGAGAAPKP